MRQYFVNLSILSEVIMLIVMHIIEQIFFGIMMIVLFIFALIGVCPDSVMKKVIELYYVLRGEKK